MAAFYLTTYPLQTAAQGPQFLPRDLQERGLDIINIKDTNGNSDQKKLTNAIIYAQTSGSDHGHTVYIPSGTYEMDDAILLPQISGNNIEIRGDGSSTILSISKLDHNGNIADNYGTIFTITGTRIRVRDMTIVYDVDQVGPPDEHGTHSFHA